MKDYAIVTGGSQGIGLAICRRLKEDGATPIIFDRVAPADPDLGEFREVDLSDTGATAAALEWALALGTDDDDRADGLQLREPGF